MYLHVCICPSPFKKMALNVSELNQILPTARPGTCRKKAATIIFTLKNEVSGLVKALKLFQVGVLWVDFKIFSSDAHVFLKCQMLNHLLLHTLLKLDCVRNRLWAVSVQEKHVSLVHIESRKSKRRDSDFEVFVDCDSEHEQLKELTELLRKHTEIVEITPSDATLRDDGESYFTPGGNRIRHWKHLKRVPFFNLQLDIYFRCGLYALVSKKNHGLGSVCQQGSDVRLWTGCRSPRM